MGIQEEKEKKKEDGEWRGKGGKGRRGVGGKRGGGRRGGGTGAGRRSKSKRCRRRKRSESNVTPLTSGYINRRKNV